MKYVLILLAGMLMAPVAAQAQTPDTAAIAAQQAAMKRLSWMLGAWRGPGHGYNQSGPYQITQTERIGTFLDGTLIVIEGKGYVPDGSVGFNAMGVISYDVPGKRYTMRSYALGHAGDFELTLGDQGYSWEIPAGPGAVIHYTAGLKDGVWTEVGDYVATGQPPRRIFEMKLQRIGNTDWPLGGGIAKD